MQGQALAGTEIMEGLGLVHRPTFPYSHRKNHQAAQDLILSPRMGVAIVGSLPIGVNCHPHGSVQIIKTSLGR
jgi:hypothetical protein